MSELKAYCPYANRDGFYHKSDVDKFIADLKENHKKKVGELLVEIENLKRRLYRAKENMSSCSQKSVLIQKRISKT